MAKQGHRPFCDPLAPALPSLHRSEKQSSVDRWIDGVTTSNHTVHREPLPPASPKRSRRDEKSVDSGESAAATRGGDTVATGSSRDVATMGDGMGRTGTATATRERVVQDGLGMEERGEGLGVIETVRETVREKIKMLMPGGVGGGKGQGVGNGYDEDGAFRRVLECKSSLASRIFGGGIVIVLGRRDTETGTGANAVSE